MSDSLYDYLPLSVLFIILQKRIEILYPIFCDGTQRVGYIRTEKRIEKKAFWVYNKYITRIDGII